MKKAIKHISLAIVSVVFFLCVVVFGANIVFTNKTEKAFAVNPNTKVTLSADKTRVVPGDTFKLTVTVTSTIPNGTWSALDFMVSPLQANGEFDATMCPYLSSPSHTTNMTTYTDSSADYFGVNPNEEVPGLRISLAWKSGNEISVSTACVFEFDIVVAENAPGGTSIQFGIEKYDTNFVDYNDMEIEVTADTDEFACNTVTVTVDAPSSDATMKGLTVGSGSATGGVAVAEQMQWKNPAENLQNFRVKVDANDPNATYQVSVGSGTATAGSFPADKTTGALKSGQESGNLNLMQNNNTTGIAKVFIRIIAPDKVATKEYCLTVTSNYVRIRMLTVTPQRPGGAAAVPKNGLDGAFSGTKYSYTVFVPSDVTDSAGVQFVPQIPGGYGISEDIAVTDVANCTASSSVKNGATLLVTNVKNNATLKLTATAASGDTQTYNFTFKTVNIDTSIASFTMTGKNDGATYNSDSTKASADYYFSLPSPTGFQGTFHIQAAQTTSKVTVNGAAYNASTQYGAGTYTVRVTAEAGNTEDYSVTVENKFDAAKFESISLSIGGGSYENILASGADGKWEGLETSSAVYTREVPVSANTEFKIKGTVSAGASVTVGGGLSEPTAGQEQVLTGSLKHGKNEFRVSLSTDEGTKVYTFVINVLEKKNTITGITLTYNGKAIDGFAFNQNTKEYNIIVPYSTANAQLAVTTDGTYTRVFADNGDQFKSDSAKREHTSNFLFTLPNPDATVNTVKFHAVSDMNLSGLSEAGDWYTITVTRSAANKDVSLNKLTITIGTKEYEISLKDGQFTYPLELTDETLDSASVSITAIPNASTSTVSGDTSSDLKFESSKGINSFNVTVTSEDGVTKQTYTIAVSRNEITLNKDISIKNVTILGNDTVQYYNGAPSIGNVVEISVPFGVTRVNITAMPGYSGASIKGDGAVELADTAGVAKEIKVYAVAEDGVTNQDGASAYIFKITRQEQRKSGLFNITIDGVQVNGFETEKTIYSHTVVSTSEKIELRAIAENEEALVKINVGVELARDKGVAQGLYAFTAEKGERDSVIFTISVEIDNETRTYTVTVTRASQSPQLKFLRVGTYGIYDKDGNLIGESDEDALNKDKTFYVNLDSANGMKIDITARASDDLAIIKLADDPEKYTGTLFYEGFDLEAKLQESVTVEIPLLVLAAGGEGNFTSYRIIFTVLTSDTSATINIFKDSNGTDPLADFNNEYVVNADLPVYGPYTVDQASLNFQINLADLGGAKGTYQVRRRNNKNEDVLMVDNGTAVDGGVRLAYGTNIFCVKITSSDKKAERTVVIVMERGGVGAKSIEVKGSEDFRFDAGATSFICSVANGVTSLKDQISVTLNNDDLEYKIVGADGELPEGGFAQIKVEIYAKSAGASATADADPLKTIYIDVFRQGAPVTVAEQTPLWQIILFWALVGLVVIELIIIIAIPKRKKNAQQVVVAAAPMAYAPVQPVQTVQPVQPQAPQTPAAPPPTAPAPPPAPAPRPAEPSRSANAKPFVSPDNSGYYGNNGGYYGNGGNSGYGGYGNGSYGNGSYGGGYGGYGNNDDNDKY